MASKRLRKIAAIVLCVVFAPVLTMVGVYLFFVLGTILAPMRTVDFQIPQNSYVDRDETVKGEPINVVIVGVDLAQDKTFEKMGWTSLQDLRQEAPRKAVTDLARGVTPISARFLFGRIQDFAYQGPDGTLFHRHHVRLWKNHLPDGTVIYYAAASYDETVGFAPAENFFLPTHVVAPDLDTERDVLGHALATQLGGALSYTDNALPVLYRQNGDNAWYYTDGMVADVTKGLAGREALSVGQHAKKDFFQVMTWVLKTGHLL